MSRKNIIPAYKLLSAEGLDANFTSDPITVNTATRVGFNISTSGITDNTGTFSVEFRVFKDRENYSDWTQLTLDTTPLLADADQQILIDVSVPPGQVRLVFSADGSTPDGTCDVWITGQEG